MRSVCDTCPSGGEQVGFPHKTTLNGEQNMKIQMAVFAGLASALVGCGPFNTFEGNVSGVTLSVKDAIFYNPKVDGNIRSTVIYLTDKENLCASLKANRTNKNLTGLAMVLIRSNADGTILAPTTGEYSVVKDLTTMPQMGAWASFNKSDANCTNSLTTESSLGQSGTVKVDKMDATANGAITGTFDITFGTQKNLTKGSFSARYCDISETPEKPSCE